MKAKWSRQKNTLILILASIPLLTGCTGLQAKMDLKTSLNTLGWSRHEMVLAVPGEYYSGQVFDRLPDFSLITGVKVYDYRDPDWQGLRVTQSFYRLGRLTGEAEAAHFLNKAYPDAPLTFQMNWEQGFFTRDLHVQVFVNTARSNALAEALSQASMVALNATFSLEMPGQVLQHNGSAVNEQTITWTLDPNMPQTLQATARVIDIPLILATVFTLGSSGLAFFTQAARSGDRGEPIKPGRPQLQPPRSRDSRPLPPPSRPPRRPVPRR